jgi:hypothetical protein
VLYGELSVGILQLTMLLASGLAALPASRAEIVYSADT